MQYLSAQRFIELVKSKYAFLFTVILEGNYRSVSIIADISRFFFFFRNQWRILFHSSDVGRGENERLTLLLTAQGCALS